MPDAVGDIRLIRNKRKLEANTTQQYPLSVLYWITQLSSSSNLKIFNQNIKFPEIIQVFGNGRSILALNKSPDWHKKQQEKFTDILGVMFSIAITRPSLLSGDQIIRITCYRSLSFPCFVQFSIDWKAQTGANIHVILKNTAVWLITCKQMQLIIYDTQISIGVKTFIELNKKSIQGYPDGLQEIWFWGKGITTVNKSGKFMYIKGELVQG